MHSLPSEKSLKWVVLLCAFSCKLLYYLYIDIDIVSYRIIDLPLLSLDIRLGIGYHLVRHSLASINFRFSPFCLFISAQKRSNTDATLAWAKSSKFFVFFWQPVCCLFIIMRWLAPARDETVYVNKFLLSASTSICEAWKHTVFLKGQYACECRPFSLHPHHRHLRDIGNNYNSLVYFFMRFGIYLRHVRHYGLVLGHTRH